MKLLVDIKELVREKDFKEYSTQNKWRGDNEKGYGVAVARGVTTVFYKDRIEVVAHTAKFKDQIVITLNDWRKLKWEKAIEELRAKSLEMRA